MGQATLCHEGMTNRDCARILSRMRRRGHQTGCPHCGSCRLWTIQKSADGLVTGVVDGGAQLAATAYPNTMVLREAQLRTVP